MTAYAGWLALADDVRACTRCPELATTRTTVVVGSAPTGARLLVMGEAPGAQEDETGRPFVGRAGQVLDAALAAAGASRDDDVAVANVLKCRPPGNRRPSPAEVLRCRGWLERQIQLIDPVVVCALGTSAAAWFLGPGSSLASRRGTVHEVDGRSVVVTYHPSGALRFGPRGAPMAALYADVAWAFALSQGAS